MLGEIAKPITLLFCMVSLCAVFHVAFLVPAIDLDERILDSLRLLTLAAGISLVSGMIFREAAAERQDGSPRLIGTLPMRIFCWASGLMVILFVVSWYLENYCVFYRDIRF
jgi:hypothetical protein